MSQSPYLMLILGLVIAAGAALVVGLAYWRGYAIGDEGKVYRDFAPDAFRKIQAVGWFILGVALVIVTAALVELVRK